MRWACRELAAVSPDFGQGVVRVDTICVPRRSLMSRPPLSRKFLGPSFKSPRQSSRHTVKIECQVVRERDFSLIADRVVDLSASGALVGPADPALTGERILVSFRIPRSTLWVDAEATVSRVVHGRRPGEFPLAGHRVRPARGVAALHARGGAARRATLTAEVVARPSQQPVARARSARLGLGTRGSSTDYGVVQAQGGPASGAVDIGQTTF